MSKYIIRRLLQAIPLLLIISFVLFVVANAMGDPLASFGGGRRRLRSADRERLTRQLGLDKPIVVQYVIWLVGNDWMRIDANGDGVAAEYGTRTGVLRGDFGTSFMEKRPVMEIIGERVRNTLILMIGSEILILSVALLIGVYSALRQYSSLDYLFTAFSFIGYSMPVFWLGLILMYIFAVNFKQWGLPYFPTVGMYDLAVGPTIPQILWHLALPLLTASIGFVAGYSRFVRSQMLEVINQDYIRTAYAKGVPRAKVITQHALKNAALPLLTLVGLDLPFLFSGAVVTETIFAWPGMGRLFWDAAQDTDVPVIMGILSITAILVIVFQILTDIGYTYLDPRIRYD
jgi:peptide/nickel transport system permease protein